MQKNTLAPSQDYMFSRNSSQLVVNTLDPSELQSDPSRPVGLTYFKAPHLPPTSIGLICFYARQI